MNRYINIIFLFISLITFSQEQGGIEANNEKEASLKVQRLAMQLDLNKEQQEKLNVLFTQRLQERNEVLEEKRQERKEMMIAREARKKEHLEFNEQQKAEMRQILTAEQYQKWEGLMEKRRNGLKTRIPEPKN